jgi:hydrogenase maturation protein HypF
VAHDLHPEYLSTKFATDLDLPARPVQHHHAHIASCLAEHGRSEPVLGLAFDGLGMGDDGTLWGGELLVADLAGYERVGHLRPVVLPGGAAAIREPWRMAVAWVHGSLGEAAARRVGRRLDDRADAVIGLVEAAHGPVTTSMGRLFDAVAALVGLRPRVTYEGQAAIELEALARTVTLDSTPRYQVVVEGEAVLDPRPLIAAVVADVEQGMAPAAVAAGFHRAIGLAAADLAALLAGQRGLDTVALSGGVFQNALLGGIVAGALREAGLAVLVHERVPPNDGGISIGQAVITAHRLPAMGARPRE